MGSNYTCNLTLGFSYEKLDQINKENQPIKEEKYTSLSKYDHILPSLSLGSLQSQQPQEIKNNTIHGKLGSHEVPIFRGIVASTSPGSSYIDSSTVKEEKVVYRGNDFEVYKTVSSRASDEEEEETNPRKKLRLTKEQSAVLEDSFKDHATLNPIEKQALARQLNLRPRQLEVWFQNRRARTKLKQTEMNCEFLKKCCETLTEENNRLHRELLQLKALKFSAPSTTLFMHMPVTICPACETISTVAGGGRSEVDEFSKPAGPVIKPKARLCSPSNRSSAAC